MQQNLPPVPLMREYVYVGQGVQPTQRNKNTALLAVICFVVPVLVGVALTVSLGSKILFLAFFVAGLLLSAGAYFVRSRLSGLGSQVSLESKVMREYQPVLSRVSSHGFDAASDSARAIIKASLALKDSQPRIFTIVDEALRFLTERLLVIGETKKIIGEERELKRRAERLQDHVKMHLEQGGPDSKAEGLRAEMSDVEQRLSRVEAINRSVLHITADLQKLRADCENALVARVTGQAGEQRAAQLLLEKMDREKRVAAELAQLGL